MSVTITARELGKNFIDAHDSLWYDRGITLSDGMDVVDQIKGWKNKFGARVYGGHFDHVQAGVYVEGEWNTIDAVVEFESKEAYVLFMLEWS